MPGPDGDGALSEVSRRTACYLRMLWRAALFHRGSMGAFAKTTESLQALWQITQGCGGESVLFASTNSRGVAGGGRGGRVCRSESIRPSPGFHTGRLFPSLDVLLRCLSSAKALASGEGPPISSGGSSCFRTALSIFRDI